MKNKLSINQKISILSEICVDIVDEIENSLSNWKYNLLMKEQNVESIKKESKTLYILFEFLKHEKNKKDKNIKFDDFSRLSHVRGDFSTISRKSGVANSFIDFLDS